MDDGLFRNDKHPHYAEELQRIESYKNWATDVIGVSPVLLARSGFFYAGFADCVRCFSCGLGIRNLQPGDVPIYYHRNLMPDCRFLHSYIDTDDAIIASPNASPNKGGVVSVNRPSFLQRPPPFVTTPSGSKTDDCCRPKTCEKKSRPLTPPQPPPKIPLDTTSRSSLAIINEELRASATCKVCLDRKSSIVFEGCGHMVTCAICAKKIRKCCICRKFIRSRIPVLMASVEDMQASGLADD